MLLEIRHTTRFIYERPVRESVMEVWMQPQKTSRQRLISFEIEANPIAQFFSYADTFGNAVYHFDVPQPHDDLTIEARSAVETQESALPFTSLDLGEWDRLRSDFVRGEWFDFLYPFGFTTPTPLLEQFIREHDLEDLRRRDPLTALMALNSRIYEAFAYTPGATAADSPIDHALEQKKGVCQDFAHIMLTICRMWGMPARYVSGYLMTDIEQGERSAPDATHAWIEVFLPTPRWIGFDPTNNTLAGARHVGVAVGRDYSDVPPTRGVFKGNSDSHLDVAVTVRRAKSAQAEPEFLRLSRPNFRPRLKPSDDSLLLQVQQQQQQ